MLRFPRKYAPDRALALAVCLVIATMSMFWLGWRASQEWERSTEQSVNARGKEVLALLAVALERDMKGGQLSVLLPVNQPLLEESSLYDLADRFAGGFARFPYLESVFVWKESGGPDGLTYFFNRAERPPPWDDLESVADPYPIVVRRDPVAARSLVTEARSRDAGGAPFVLFEAEVAGVRYQTLAQLIYRVGGDVRLAAMVGFTVNLEWVRRHYFLDLIHQIQKISGDGTIRIEILDQAERLVAETGPAARRQAVHAQTFPLAFSDRAFVSGVTPLYRAPRWTARLDMTSDTALVAARRGLVRTLGLLAFGAVATAITLLLTVKAARAAADLSSQQSEFVAAVSHEMKTPLSLITLASDSLAHGRYSSPDTISDYGRLLSAEARQLTRLIDNVLCYARIGNAKQAYSYESVDLPELVEDSVERFEPELKAHGVDVHVDVPVDSPGVRADRTMMQHVVDNLIDNAIKHAASGKTLVLKVLPDNGLVRLEVTDRGHGVPPDEVPHIFDKFYRGKGAKHRGSGLGLSIAQRIVEEHGGTIGVSTVIGEGTTVAVTLPTTTNRH